MEGNININIKQAQQNSFQLTLHQTDTVLHIKKGCQQQTDIDAAQIRLILKGAVLKDSDTIQSLNLTDNCAIHMVDSKGSDGSSSQQQQKEGGPSIGDILTGLGGMAGMGGLGGLGGGLSGGLSDGINPQMMQGMMNDPMVSQMMSNVLSNPQMMQNIIQSNPMLQSVVGSNPQLKQALNDPNTMKMLSNPAVMQYAMSMMGGQPQGQQNQQQQMKDLAAIFGMPQRNPNINSNLPPQERFKEQIQQCRGMGFTDNDKIIEALKATNGDLETAVETMLNQM